MNITKEQADKVIASELAAKEIIDGLPVFHNAGYAAQLNSEALTIMRGLSEGEPNRCVRELLIQAKANPGTYFFPGWNGNRIVKYLGTSPQAAPADTRREFELQPKDLLYADSSHTVHAMQPDMIEHIRARVGAAMDKLVEPAQTDCCEKCGGNMKPGKAIAQTMTGSPDFAGDQSCVTISPGGPGRLIDCLKCADCGWSVSERRPEAQEREAFEAFMLTKYPAHLCHWVGDQYSEMFTRLVFVGWKAGRAGRKG